MLFEWVLWFLNINVFFIGFLYFYLKGVKFVSLELKRFLEIVGKDYYIGFLCLDLERSFVGSNICGFYFKEFIEVLKDGFIRELKEFEKE